MADEATRRMAALAAVLSLVEPVMMHRSEDVNVVRLGHKTIEE